MTTVNSRRALNGYYRDHFCKVLGFCFVFALVCFCVQGRNVKH